MLYWWKKNRSKKREERYRAMLPDQVFTTIFRGRKWSSRESASGRGSELVQTSHLISAIPFLMDEIGANVLLDLPCGDFNWMRHADLSGKRYIGGDIVPELIEANQAEARENVEFRVIDLTRDALPEADLVMVRDCLVHLETSLIRAAVNNIRASGIPWVLTTTYPGTGSNAEIVTGQWRSLDLESAPFGFPPPERRVAEVYFPPDRPAHGKSMGLWRTADLPTL